MDNYQAVVRTPWATMGVACDDAAVFRVEFLLDHPPEVSPQNALAEEVCRQLLAYGADPAFPFDLPLGLTGTPHRMRVWRALQEIPSGKTVSYSALARVLGSSPRAVGQACGANPVAVIVPCHRVVAQTGLGGFMNHSGGRALDVKSTLLAHEHPLF